MQAKQIEKRCAEAYQTFFEAMLKGGFKAIVEAASCFFDSPVLLIDDKCQLIYQLPERKIGDSTWDTYLEKKALPMETIYEYQKFFLDDKVESSNLVIYKNKGMVADYPRIYGQIYNNSEMLGQIVIYTGKRSLMEGDMESAGIFIDALRMEFRRRTKEVGGWPQSNSSCIIDLLDKDSSYQIKNLAVRTLQSQFKVGFAVIVTPIGTNAAKKAFAIYAVRELSLKYSSIVPFIYNDSVLTFLSGIQTSKYNTDNIDEEPTIKQVVNFFYSHDMISGIGDCFQSLYDLQIYYKQALITAKFAVKKNKKPLGIFSQYATLLMFFSLSKEDFPEVYIHPLIAQLHKYDIKNNTQYFETLKVYSFSMHNKESAARDLSIHRNTLLYRLNRIQELFGVSYEENRIAIHLLISYLLWDAMI